MWRNLRHPMLLLGVVLAVAACRPVAVETEPGPYYVLEVNNANPYPMIVYYDDGTGTHLLGTVSARSRAEFAITRPARQTVRIFARDENDTHRVEDQVTLRAEARAQVTLPT
jgi:hypothetical protein